ncbi:hypothetical protein LJR129_003878 [Acidovorax sp. LjRoot129]
MTTNQQRNQSQSNQSQHDQQNRQQDQSNPQISGISKGSSSKVATDSSQK